MLYNSYNRNYIIRHQNYISDDFNSINSIETETLPNTSEMNEDDNNTIKTVLIENNFTDIKDTSSVIGRYTSFKLKMLYNLYSK